MTIDDNIVDFSNNPIPHVGMPTTEDGYQGGEVLANLARERGFFDEGNNVKVMSITVSFKTFLLERPLGYHGALRKFAPEIPEENYIQEDNATGMFEEAGFPLENDISCGLGGYNSSYEEFQKDQDSYIVNKTQPYNEGKKAAELMYAYLTDGTELPDVTYVPGTIVYKDNYQDFDRSM